MREARSEVWIGLADVRPRLGNSTFDGAPGAFSNVVCFAHDEHEYRRSVAATFQELGFDVKGFEDVEPLANRREHLSPDDEILELAAQLSEVTPLLYDTFYIYESEFDE
jgi:hypothetical protein